MENQFGFTSGDSGTSQLISYFHDIHSILDDDSCLEIRSIFLDTFKDFEKVWHETFCIDLRKKEQVENF